VVRKNGAQSTAVISPTSGNHIASRDSKDARKKLIGAGRPLSFRRIISDMLRVWARPGCFAVSPERRIKLQPAYRRRQG
jgi:hypothetical protein